jgi:hypothetical protein
LCYKLSHSPWYKNSSRSGASLKPFQMDFEGNTKPLNSPDDDLSFGIGTIFVEDPSENLVEFLQLGHGIF